MDRIDKKILACLQEDAALSLNEVANRVGLSVTPCWRRIQKLEEMGVIRGRVALIDPTKVNLGVTVFVSVRTNRHDPDWLRQFSLAVTQFPEVMDFYRLSGGTDYMLRVVVPDIAAYDSFYKKLIEQVPIYDVSSSFAMENIRAKTQLPLDYMAVGD